MAEFVAEAGASSGRTPAADKDVGINGDGDALGGQQQEQEWVECARVENRPGSRVAGGKSGLLADLVRTIPASRLATPPRRGRAQRMGDDSGGKEAGSSRALVVAD